MRVILFASGVIAGLAWGLWVQPSAIPTALLLAFAGGAAFLSPGVRWRRAGLAAVGIGVAVLRVALLPTPLPTLPEYIGVGPVSFSGTIVGDPEERDGRHRLRIRVDTVDNDALPQSEDVLVWTQPPPQLVQDRDAPYFRYGDRLLLSGELEAPPVFPDFDYRDYLARQGVRAVSYSPRAELVGEGGGPAYRRLLGDFRARLATSLERSLPEPQASLAKALLLGDRSGLPSDLREAFSRTGASHLLAVSGLHVSVVLALLVWASAAALGRRRQVYLLVPLAGVWVYALLAGFGPPVQRAAVMGSFYLAGRAAGRQHSGAIALALSGVVLALVDPPVLSQVSFQLSFLAMLGLLYLAPLLERPIAWAWRDDGMGWRRYVTSSAAASLGATIATWPLVAFNFHVVSFTSVPVTLLALPALPALILVSLLTALAGLFLGPLGTVLGWLAWPWPTYLVSLVHLFDLLPFASLHLDALGTGLVWLYYATLALLVGVLFQQRPLAGTPTGRPLFAAMRLGVFAMALPLLALANGVIWWLVLSPPSDRLEVVFLDVGQGDAILIQAPSGRRVLVDGGPSRLTLERHLGRELPFWDRGIDLVVNTHPHRDHLDGLVSVLERHPVQHILQTQMLADSSTYAEWTKLLGQERIPMTTAQAGQRVDLGGAVWLDVLHPPPRPLLGTGSDLNENSVVLRLTYGRASFLLTGDIQAVAETYLVREGDSLASVVLKVAHQGSNTSSTQVFLDAVTPQVAVVTVGEDNPFGHPSQEVLNRLREYVGQRLFLTRDHGTVRISTDGERLWATADR